MDDYPASYEKVPTVTASSEILKQIVPECGDTRTSFSASSSSPRDAKSGLDRRIYSTTLRQRLHDLANTEQGLLTLIFTGTAALDDNARLRFQSIIPDGEILDLFIGVVAELYEAGCELVRIQYVKYLSRFISQALGGTMGFSGRIRFRQLLCALV
jgi:hypothetical protein